MCPYVYSLKRIRLPSRKKDGNVFLVAFYECEDDFDLVELENDHLYCSRERWIGVRPRCVPLNDGNGQEDYDGDGDDDDLDEDEENNETSPDDDGMWRSVCMCGCVLLFERFGSGTEIDDDSPVKCVEFGPGI